MDLFKLVYGGATGSGLQGTSTELQELKEFESSLEEAYTWLKNGVVAQNEGFGWLELPYQERAPLMKYGNWLKNFDYVVQIGIGGSALGNLMLMNALAHQYNNEIPSRKRKGPAFYVADNVDPCGNRSILDVVDLSRTALVVVSKSGSTAETMANFLYFYNKLKGEVDREHVSEHILVITDETRGSLRAFAVETGCRSLTIPSGVGGRYSVLSAVGLVSAVAMGIDIDGLLDGAGQICKKLNSLKGIYENPAWLLAALHYFHYRRGRNIDVIMPYSDKLEDFGEWYVQLCAESLGKQSMGFTPMRALGSIDQHSQVQLYTEGPDDKLFTIIDITRKEDLTIPESDVSSLKGLSYLYNKQMGQMLSFEAMSTAVTILQSGKPVVWIQIGELSARTLGALIFFFEYVIAITGRLLGVNPFNQPGVEQGKNYTYGFMGRKGYDEYRKQGESLFQILQQNFIEV